MICSAFLKEFELNYLHDCSILNEYIDKSWYYYLEACFSRQNIA